MSIDEIIEFVEGLGGAVTVRPESGDGSPEIAWGDVFVFYAPDGVVPKQPFASIVTKDYPDDEKSRLDRPDTFRVNVGAGTEEFQRYAGHPPREPVAADANLAEADVVIPHPVYGYLSGGVCSGWSARSGCGCSTARAAG